MDNTIILGVLALIIVIVIIVVKVSKRKDNERLEYGALGLENADDRKSRITHITALVAAAMADGKIEDSELAVIVGVAKREGFSDQEIKNILEGKMKTDFAVPSDDVTKRRYLKDLIAIMMVDGNIAEQEFTLCSKMAVCYGFSPNIIKELVDELLSNTSSVQTVHGTKRDVSKEEGRYYFYDNRCSFKLSKDEIDQAIVEKNGMKHTLMTKSMVMTIIEIRPCMPNFGGNSMVETKNMKVAGYPCLMAEMMGMTRQYYINCGPFVVQVDMVVVSEEFLNSFRLEN